MRTFAFVVLYLLAPFILLCGADVNELSSDEMSGFVQAAEAHFVSELGLPQEALDKRWRRDSLADWIPEGSSYESVLTKFEEINAANGYSFRIIRDKNYLCIERTYYRKWNGMAISLMIVMDGERNVRSSSLSRSLYKLPIES